MATTDLHNQYFTIESRLESFKISQSKPTRRTSVASKKNQKTAWPHSFLSPQSVSRAIQTHDCVDNLDAFEARVDLDFAGAFLLPGIDWYSLMSLKKAQSLERF